MEVNCDKTYQDVVKPGRNEVTEIVGLLEGSVKSLLDLMNEMEERFLWVLTTQPPRPEKEGDKCSKECQCELSGRLNDLNCNAGLMIGRMRELLERCRL